MSYKLSYQTAGESHGPCVLAIVNGLPSGLTIDSNYINAELTRRQGGYGRSARQTIESDTCNYLAGVRSGKTTGAPVALQIPNKDNRLNDATQTPPIHKPRPGHADLAGGVKHLTADCRNILERTSARETAARVAAGAIATCLLREFHIQVFGFVRSIYTIKGNFDICETTLDTATSNRDNSDLYCPDLDVTKHMKDAIDAAKQSGDTVGGIVEAHVFGCPIGLGSSMNWYDKLDAQIAAAVMSIQAFKGIEIGLGFNAAHKLGSEVHDPIEYNQSKQFTSDLGYDRPTNNAGGLEGGMTNGQPIVIRAAMKPISTLRKGLPSIDLNSNKTQTSHYERSDICAVSAASVVLQNVIAFEIAAAFRDKFAGDSLTEVRMQYDSYMAAAHSLAQT